MNGDPAGKREGKDQGGGNNPRPGPKGDGSGGGRGPMKISRGALGWMVFISMALLLVMLMTRNYQRSVQIDDINQFYTHLENKQIQEVVVGDRSIRGKFRDYAGRSQTAPLNFELDFPPHMMDSDFMKELRGKCEQTGTALRYKSNDNIFVQVFLPLIPWLLIFGLIWFFVIRQMRSATGGAGMLGSFGRSRHRVMSKEHTNITFVDVAGIDEAKEEVSEIIEVLRNPKKFQRTGGRIPRGVLLIG